MTDRKDLIKALRCSARVKTAEDDCLSCPYGCKEEVSKDFPAPPDVTIEGVDYWLGCDVEKMAVDAANMLTQDAASFVRINNLCAENEKLIKQLLAIRNEDQEDGNNEDPGR